MTFTPAIREAGLTQKCGPRVDRDLLLSIILPHIDKVGLMEFCRRAGIDPRQMYNLRHGINGYENPRLYFADRMLTLGMGRPDLVGLVCPAEPR